MMISQIQVIIGLQPRGVFFARKIIDKLSKILSLKDKIKYGELDSTFFRDDFRRKKQVLKPKYTSIDFLIENKNVILIDDVLYTGRSIRSLDSIVTFGRPKKIELLVMLINRFSRELPVEPKYVGKSVDVINFERVLVDWNSRNVLLLNN